MLQAQEGLLQFHVEAPMEKTPNEFAVILIWKDLASLAAGSELV
jgi:heme-degrading monooxygenase HmoA